MYFTIRDVLLRNAPLDASPMYCGTTLCTRIPERLVTFFANHDVAGFASEEGSFSGKAKSWRLD